MEIGELNSILGKMDLPRQRLDLSNESNLRWLLRNISIRNRDSKDCERAEKAIVNLLKQFN